MRRAAGPSVVGALLVVTEVTQRELERAVGPELHDAAHLGHVARLAVRREAHHLVLIAIVRKAEELGDRLIEDAERVREEHAPEHLDRAGFAAPQPRSRSRRSRRAPSDRALNVNIEARGQVLR